MTARTPYLGQMRGASLFGSVCVSLILAGCTYSAEMIDDAGLEYEPLVERLPVIIGIYYSDDFTNNIVRAKAEEVGDTYVFDVGECSVLLFNQVVNSMFRDVKHIDSPPSHQAQEMTVAGVLIPKFISLDVATGRSGVGFKQSKTVSVNYEINLVERDGSEIDSWQVSGTGVKTHGPTYFRGKYASDAAREAIRDALAKFLVQFEEREITRYRLLEIDASVDDIRE